MGVDFNPGFYTKDLALDDTGPDGEPISPKLITKGASTKVTSLPVHIRKVPKKDAPTS